jgi:hypothetical protein
MIQRRRIVLGALFALATLSGGCASNGMFNNEVVCAEAGKLRFISFYGPVGIAAKVDSSPIKCSNLSEGVK